MAVIYPYTKGEQRHVTVALLTDQGKVISEHGERFVSAERFRERHPGGKVFASIETVSDLARDGRGEILIYDNLPKRWRAAPINEYQWYNRGDDVVAVASPSFPRSHAAALAGLVGWRDWLESYGAHPTGSMGGTTFSLLRARLRGPVWTMGGEPPPFTWTVGGRQELPAWTDPYSTYRNVVHLDLPSAYPTAMAGLRCGRAIWRRVGSGFYARHRHELDEMDNAWPLVLYGKVTLPPGLVWGPLVKRRLEGLQVGPRHPERAAILGGRMAGYYPAKGRILGAWTWPELRVAISLGAEIVPLQVWLLANDGGRPFLPWWEACQEGRAELDGFAEHLCKLTAAACWGQFVTSENGHRAAYSVELGRRPLPPPHRQEPSYDLGEMVTATVRARAADFLSRMGERVICFHTDGGWVDLGDAETPRGWATKMAADQLDVIDQQNWRARSLPGRPWRYTVAGVPRDQAEESFARHWASSPKGKGK